MIERQAIMVQAIRMIVITILSIAVVNKISFARLLLAGDSLLSRPWILTAGVGVECFAIAFFLMGNRQLAWWVGTVLFSLFTPLAAWSWWNQVDCGCFGKAELSWLSLPIDLVVLAMLLFTRRLWTSASADGFVDSHHSPLDFNSRDARAVGIATWFVKRQSILSILLSLFASVVGLLLLWMSLHIARDSSKVEYLFADELVGKPWPLIQVEGLGAQQMKSGKWIILIVRKDCEHCRKLVETLRDVEPTKFPCRVITMIAGSNQWPVVEGEIAMDSQESSTLDWGSEGEPFVASPAAFVIEDGIVTAAKDGKEADKLVFEVMGFDAQSKK